MSRTLSFSYAETLFNLCQMTNQKHLQKTFNDAQNFTSVLGNHTKICGRRKNAGYQQFLFSENIFQSYLSQSPESSDYVIQS